MRLPRLDQIFPFLTWQRPSRASLREDLMAGVSVALLAVPQSLAYAQLAGLPAFHGLYAAFIPCMVGVLWGSSSILSTGPVAMTSLLTASSVGLLVAQGTEDFLVYALLLSLLSGLIQIALGLARAGVLLNLLSHPVLVGFINAAAVLIALSQLSAMTGIALNPGASTLVATAELLGNIGRLHVLTLVLGVSAIIILLGLRRYAPKLPGVLIMVAVLTLVSYLIGFADRGGAVVGAIPQGLPELSTPALDWDATVGLIPAAIIVALVSFMEAMSSAKVIANKTRGTWNENQELIGQGLAKVAAAFCNAMPVSGSFSRSALNLSSRARSGYSSLFAAAFVLLCLLFFTSLMFHLPKPALAAMIILAVVNLIDVSAMRNAWRASRDDGVAAVLTFVATLTFAPNIQNGILAGITFSLGAFIYRRMIPRMTILRLSDTGKLREIARLAPTTSDDKLVAFRFEAALFFANASFFEEAIRKIERDNPKLKHILVIAHSINLLDDTGVEMLRKLLTYLESASITLSFSHGRKPFLDVLERTGLIDEIGRHNLFDSDELALIEIKRRLEAGKP